MDRTLFEELGGEPALRAIIDRFVARLFSDMMIGFHFAKVDPVRLRQLEFEFAAEHLGAGTTYSGRPLTSAHRVHRIFDGQFARRTTILRETLAEFGVPKRVRDAWISHTEALKDQVISGPCEAPPALDGETAPD